MATNLSSQEILGLSLEATFTKLHSHQSGLDPNVVSERIREFGANQIERRSVRPLQIFFRQFHSSFIYLLFAASIIATFLNEYADAALIFFFLLLNAGLGFWQEYRAEHSLELLKDFTARHTNIRRGGVINRIPVTEVVPGDIVVLAAGDMIPADGRFIKAEAVTVDESPLTGESEPAQKDSEIREIEEKSAFPYTLGYARTTLLSGDAELLVYATGKDTVVGGIADAIVKAETQSAFQEGVGKFSSFVLKLVLVTVPVVFLLNSIVHYDTIDYAEFLIFSIALTVSVIPEALPLVTTLSLSRGALYLAKKQVVPRRLSAIEDLGSIQVLCTDKTGTITENRLTVAEIFGKKEEVLSYALTLSVIDPERKRDQNGVYDAAILALQDSQSESYARGAKILDELPFDPVRRRDTILFEKDGKKILVTRGAPENVGSGELSQDAKEWISKEGKKGRRVLAVGHYNLGESPISTITEVEDRKVGFVGMISFYDPLKPSARQAIRDAEALGVRVKIITGDAKEVAGWVGVEAGIISDPSMVMSGEDFEELSPYKREKAAMNCDVFARTSPSQKFAIIQALERNALVGFLGEGFNDAPALKMAHVGLAVSNASDIAQDASDVVLLNPSLEVIVDGIREGRKIFANSMKYLKATLTSNFGNFYALALSSLFIPFLPMLPIQVLLLNLLSDTPMISIAGDTVDEEETRSPRGYQVREVTAIAVVLGVISTIFDFAFFGYFVRFDDPKVLQTMWFVGSILTELILLFSIRTALPFWRASRPSNLVLMLSGAVALLTILIPYIPIFQRLFGFIAPAPGFMATTLILLALYFASTEIAKLVFYRYWNGRHQMSV